MIDPEYVRTMARYNTWQNNQLMPVLEAMTTEELTKDRAAFFGSIFATANHLLWGDTLWMSRFDPSVPAPDVPAEQNTQLHQTIHAWSADRFRLDGKIRIWASNLKALDLKGTMTFFSRSVGGEATTPVGTAIVHFFNHQTHHRGQIHAMLTAAGQQAPVSDLFLMPKDA